MKNFLIILLFLGQNVFGQERVLSNVHISNKYMAEYKDKLYFNGVKKPEAEGFEFCVFDGKRMSSYDLWPGRRGSSPSYLTVYKDKLYFSATVPVSQGVGAQLCVFEGNEVKQIGLHPKGYSSVKNLVVYEDKLYFTGTDGKNKGIWSWDGENFKWENLFNNTQINNLIVYQNALHFTIYKRDTKSGTYKTYLYSWDGGGIGRGVLRPLSSKIPSSQNFIVYNNTLCFEGDTREEGKELWIWNGKGLKIIDIRKGVGDSYPEHFTEYNNKLYFSALKDKNTRCLYNWDGKNVNLVADNMAFWGMIAYKDMLYFSGKGKNGDELWSYNGKKCNEVADIHKGKEPSFAGGFFIYNNILYFHAIHKYGKKNSGIYAYQ